MSGQRASNVGVWVAVGVGAFMLLLGCGVVGFAAMIVLYGTSHRRVEAPVVSVGPASAPEPAVVEPAGIDFIDGQTGLSWGPESASDLERDAARSACAAIGWRLPARSELEAMRQSPDPSRDAPLREPLASRNTANFLWTGDEVPGRPGHPWVMNTVNGHTFNGHGRRAHARCVR
jgi:hypothetical protein